MAYTLNGEKPEGWNRSAEEKQRNNDLVNGDFVEVDRTPVAWRHKMRTIEGDDGTVEIARE